MRRKQWYLIQYDIADPARLRRVHKRLKSCALAVQNLVFAWYGCPKELAQLQQVLKRLINRDHDDVRGYRLKNPLLLIGRSPFVEDAYFVGLPPHQHCPLEWLEQHPAGFF